ncbi:MAG: UDP-N-acetylglucosamine 2-epimerase [Terriglobia bacterium]|nr:UDP-N-acetylglucosamine 2-epimerase [Terriglobia bacterium]
MRSFGKSRKITFLTATRADFGKLKPLIAKVAGTSRYDYDIFATGMHMLSRYGSTLGEIYKSGFKNVYPYTNQDGSVTSQMDLVLANTVHGLGLHIREQRPDLLVVHGDRVEALAGAIVGVLNNIHVAHIEGGELSGTVDEVLRHAVTKLSHVHFVANQQAAARLQQLGERPSSIFVIGSPDIDVMFSENLPKLEDVKERYAIGFDEYAIFIYHPVTTEHDSLRTNIRETIAALLESGKNFVVIQPNNDYGADIIQEEISPLASNPRFRLLPSMRFEYFLCLLKHSRFMAGNSSAGIREAPGYGVPTLNIGSRQSNRWHHVSIVNVPENRTAILDGLKRLPTKVSPVAHFGDGRSADRFLAILDEPLIWETPTQKLFQDMPAAAFSTSAERA